MKISLSFPRPSTISNFLKIQSTQPFTYKDVGASRTDVKVKGFDNDHNSMVIGKGEDTWQAAKEVLNNWNHFPSKWTKIEPAEKGIFIGNNVSVLFRIFGIWFINSARIVYIIEEENKYGFAYGTLTGHIEKGEEIFYIERDETGTISYHIKAFSKPNNLLVWLGYPMARFFQRRFVRESMNQVKELVKKKQV